MKPSWPRSLLHTAQLSSHPFAASCLCSNKLNFPKHRHLHIHVISALKPPLAQNALHSQATFHQMPPEPLCTSSCPPTPTVHFILTQTSLSHPYPLHMLFCSDSPSFDRPCSAHQTELMTWPWDALCTPAHTATHSRLNLCL